MSERKHATFNYSFGPKNIKMSPKHGEFFLCNGEADYDISKSRAAYLGVPIPERWREVDWDESVSEKGDRCWDIKAERWEPVEKFGVPYIWFTILIRKEKILAWDIPEVRAVGPVCFGYTLAEGQSEPQIYQFIRDCEEEIVAVHQTLEIPFGGWFRDVPDGKRTDLRRRPSAQKMLSILQSGDHVIFHDWTAFNNSEDFFRQATEFLGMGIGLTIAPWGTVTKTEMDFLSRMRKFGKQRKDRPVVAEPEPNKVPFKTTRVAAAERKAARIARQAEAKRIIEEMRDRGATRKEIVDHLNSVGNTTTGNNLAWNEKRLENWMLAQNKINSTIDP